MESAARRSSPESEIQTLNQRPIQIQKVLPVCDFGRSDNLFYQSRGSLCAKPLTLEQIFEILETSKEPLSLPSHVLERPDWEEIRLGIAARPEIICRLLIAWGEELDFFKEKILQLSTTQWSLDIIIDRPHLGLQLETLDSFPRRWLLIAHRFFDLRKTYETVVQQISAENLKIVFLEPLDKEQFLLAPDEIILWKHWLEADADLASKVDYLSLQSIHQECDAFFKGYSREVYRENFVSYGQLKTLRKTLMIQLPDRKSWGILISIVLQKFLILFLQPKATIAHAYRSFILFLRWKVPSIAKAIRLSMWIFFRWRITDFFKRLWISVVIVVRFKIPAFFSALLLFIRWQMIESLTTFLAWVVNDLIRWRLRDFVVFRVPAFFLMTGSFFKWRAYDIFVCRIPALFIKLGIALKWRAYDIFICRIPGYFHLIGVFLRWRVYEVTIQFFNGRLPELLLAAWTFFRYKFLKFLFYPFIKILWILDYQFKKRFGRPRDTDRS